MEASTRVIRTYVLRLLIDKGEPNTLRGAVQSVASGEEHPFADGPALLTLLHQMAGDVPGSGGCPHDETTDHHEERSEP
jgi:hypothetical protein